MHIYFQAHFSPTDTVRARRREMQSSISQSVGSVDPASRSLASVTRARGRRPAGIARAVSASADGAPHAHLYNVNPVELATVHPAEKLRALLCRSGCVTMPSCYDALSARLIARSQFECAFMSGYGVSASRMGDPDVGLASLDVMADAGRHICRSAGALPIMGDGDTGFGGVANVQRTVFEYHRAGFAAVTIEDQVFPKRCAFAAGMNVVSREEAMARLAAALGEFSFVVRLRSTVPY